MAQCTSCGEQLATASRFCPACGVALVTDVFATRTVAAPASRPRTTSSLSAAPLDGSRLPPGALLTDRYRIVALLGRGGMGEVYRAEDLKLGQAVALKFLPEEIASNPAAVARFYNEVRIARQVSHPNVCRVYDVGELDGRLFLSMEYVDGEDLGSLLRRIGRLPADKALEIAHKLCSGLAAAHATGVLHRDIKPGNVMLNGRGHVVLTDFGLAGLAGSIEGAEIRSGTPAYMAPEQLAGTEVTVRSDIYSLGVLFYELFTGKRPHGADTLAGLIRERSESVPASPATLVSDLDPVVERVILRCLEVAPALRPPSALAVAAALPGGDPLAAALAAGETPSPEMVAAAGEGRGLKLKYALPLMLATMAGIIANAMLLNRTSALERVRPELSGEVLRQKARDVVQSLGYNARPFDHASGFRWSGELYNFIAGHDKPVPRWDAVFQQSPSLLRFWYRQADAPLYAPAFHDDLLTAGVVTQDDPPATEAGMLELELDHRGRLLSFQAIPPSRDTSTSSAAPNWEPLFAAAGIDPRAITPTEPQWNTLAASDTRAAWTGQWPESGRPLRVEAAALHGKPVHFALSGPWTKPERMPDASPPSANTIVLLIIIVASLGGAAILGRFNLGRGRGDRRGAIRLSGAIVIAQFIVFLLRTHFAPSIFLLGSAFVTLCTAVGWGAVIWTLYIAIDPFVRRYWPQAIISWSSVLAGNLRDPVVGRDALYGVALATLWRLGERITDFVVPHWAPGAELSPLEPLNGLRATAESLFHGVSPSVRIALIWFMMMFILRVILRKQWLAGAAFVVVWLGRNLAGAHDHLVGETVITVFIYGIVAVSLLRLGLFTLTTAVFVADRADYARALQPGAWYFPETLLILAVLCGLTLWSFRVATAGQKLVHLEWE